MKLLNWLAAAMLGLLAAAGSALAQAPEEIVRGIYEGGGARSSIDRLRAPGARNRYFQPALVRLFDANDREECIDFGLHINGQDFDEAEIARSLRLEARQEGERAVVEARFRSFGKPNHFRFEFLRSGESWKIADIASLAPDERWRLSATPCRGVRAVAAAENSAAGPGQLRRPGRYCFASRSSQLKIDVASSGSAQISLDHLGQNGHTCGLEGIGRPVGSGWQLELEGVKGPCRLTLVVSPAGRLTTRDPGGSCRATYCGMRAELADVAIDLRRGKRPCRN
ncbi:hypothetical protein [Bosea sp. (in: a-proteobacteria)]|uniref:hypothetical protein n=1 Tax=Bosea sp. (in: a-proteobacteria) TaxID=1871050 RepID=UPI001AC75A41|nr:hypothetical protein [Bosea sp. (in: a-proteobacteria)]MBN9438368.1 hypothetical protein [Bosea sp. (in: a-proteobacteria)]